MKINVSQHAVWVPRPDEDCADCQVTLRYPDYGIECGRHGVWESVQVEEPADRRFANYRRSEEGNPIEALTEMQAHWPEVVAVVTRTGVIHDPTWEVIVTVDPRPERGDTLCRTPAELAEEMGDTDRWIRSSYVAYRAAYPETA